MKAGALRKAALLLLVAFGLAGCGGPAARWIDEAATAHAQADALVRGGEPGRAARVLEELVSRPVPGGVATQDRRAVLQDAYARLAGLALEQREPVQALRYADVGLALGVARDVFNSALHILRGRAHEALGQDAEAARDYEAAQIVAEALLQEALSGEGPR
jgi:predicted RNA-binding Zn ribbon-like protein